MDYTVYYKQERIDVFNEIIRKYGRNEFKSPYRSTIPLLIYFKDQQWNNFGLIQNANSIGVKYVFEHETPVINGKGRPSCTDLMIESHDTCIAVEAKRTEPSYSIVKKWLGSSDNKKRVLNGWLEIISGYVGNKIDIGMVENLPYQLIHRVASACFMKKLKTHVVYLGFELDKAKMNYYSSNIDLLLKLLNNKISIKLICFQIDKSEEQTKLELLWDSGERDLFDFVINGFVNDALMKFTPK